MKITKYEQYQIGIINNFYNSLIMLASDYEIQRKVLPEFVVITDEIVIDFFNWYEALKSHAKIYDELINNDNNILINKLIITLDDLETFGKEIWTEDSLKNHSGWNEIRVNAKKVLNGLNIKYQKPVLNSMYIKND